MFLPVFLEKLMHRSVFQEHPGVAMFKESRFRLLPYLCGFFVVIFIGRLQELLPELSSLYLGKVAFALNFLYFIFTFNLDRVRVVAKYNVIFKIILYIFILSICSIPFSVWPSGSLKFVIDVMFLNVFFYFILCYASSNEKNIALLVYFCLLTVAIIVFFAFGVTDMDRVSVSDTYDSNDTAYIMVCFFPLAYYVAKAKKGVFKLALFLLVGAMVVVIIKTGSRGGFLSLLVTIVLILLKDRKNMIKMGLVAVFLAVIFSMFAGQDYWDRMSSITDTEDYNYSARGGRLDLWKAGMRLMFSNPVLGVGVGQYNVAEGLSHADVGGKWSTAHNAYIQIGVELGFPGLVLFILLLTKNIAFIRNIQKDKYNKLSSINMQAIASGLEVGLCGYCICVVFLSQAYSPVLMYLSAMVTGVGYMHQKSLHANIAKHV